MRKTWGPAGISPPVLAFLLSLACLPVFLSPCRAAFGPGGSLPVGTVSLPYIQWSASANGGLGGWVIVGTYPLSHLGTQSANTVLAGPASGATAASVTARALVPLDIPAGLAGTGLTSTAGVLSVTTPVPVSAATNTFLAAPNGSIGALSARAIAYPDLSAGLNNASGAVTVTGNSSTQVAGGIFGFGTGFNGGKFYTSGTAPSLVDLGFDPGNTGAYTSGFRVIRMENRAGQAYTGSAPEFQIGGNYNQNVGPPTLSLSDSSIVASQPFIPHAVGIVPVTIKGLSGQTAALLDTTNSTSSTHYFQVMPSGHLILGGTVPSAAIGAAASAVTVSTTATDARGVLTCTMIASPTAGQAITTVTFAAAYAVAPVVVISPSSAGAVSAGAYVSAVSTTGFTITEANAGPASGTVAVSYIILQ